MLEAVKQFEAINLSQINMLSSLQLHLWIFLDILEFEEACDHFTNKPVAVSLTRQPSIKKSGEIMSENAVIGTVLTEAKASRPNCVSWKVA